MTETAGSPEQKNVRKNENKEAVRAGLRALYRKELTDHINGIRFYILLILLTVISAASLSGAVPKLAEAISADDGFAFLKLFTTSGTSMYSFMTSIAFFGPLVGITLGFDAINNERSLGTLNRLASQPIYRDSIINAKFLAGATVITMTIFAMGLIVSGLGILMTGLTPSGEEVMRIFAFLVFTSVYVCFWLAVAVIFSVVCRHAATAALASISIWLFFSLFMSLAASGITNFLHPINDASEYDAVMANYTTNLALNRISPYYLFTEAASTILDPNVRSVGIVTTSQLYGAVSGYLPFGQSLLLVWPHLVGMAALAGAGFAAAYISFMKQEIRT